MGSCGRGAYGAEKMVVSEGLRGCCSTTTEGEADCVGSCREKMSCVAGICLHEYEPWPEEEEGGEALKARDRRIKEDND